MQPQCVKTFIRYPNGVRILEVPVDANRNLQQHRRIAAAISDALR